MKESEILARLKDWNTIDAGECNELTNALSFFIMDYEESLHDQNLIVSNKWLTIREASKSNDMADKMLEISAEYQKREKDKLTLGQLRRMRADLKDRLKILTFSKF